MTVSESAKLWTITIGASAGGLDALSVLLPELPERFPAVLMVVQHLHSSDAGRFAEHLARLAPLPVAEAADKTRPEPGTIYVAPANYHLLVERDGVLALSIDPPVNWSRPSIDVLFEAAAGAFGGRLAAVLLSGASRDGMRGMAAVRKRGGLTMAQDPATAATPLMPRCAIRAGVVDEVLAPEAIGRRLVELVVPGEGWDETPADPTEEGSDSGAGCTTMERQNRQ